MSEPEDDWEERGAAAKMQAEIERLRGIVQFGEDASRQQREGFQAEIERLKAALQEIADQRYPLHGAYLVARAALEGK